MERGGQRDKEEATTGTRPLTQVFRGPRVHWKLCPRCSLSAQLVAFPKFLGSASLACPQPLPLLWGQGRTDSSLAFSKHCKTEMGGSGRTVEDKVRIITGSQSPQKPQGPPNAGSDPEQNNPAVSHLRVGGTSWLRISVTRRWSPSSRHCFIVGQLRG